MRPCGCVLAVLVTLGTPPAAWAETACVACHTAVSLQVVEASRRGVHFEVDLSCHDCHGGNPDPQLAGDMQAAMDPGYAENPYEGVPAPRQIPESCGACHADPTFMKRYRADPRVDQLREYWTSEHGRALRQGDTQVATCVSCHGVHGVRRVGNPEAEVYPTRVAATCGRCHSDADLMSGYTEEGRPLPIDQYPRWQTSVHATALLDAGQLSAPTCNDCHGDHGAAPPGVESISRVCGECHGREAELFRASPKAPGFERHRAYLAGAGEQGCAACHPAANAPAGLGRRRELTECGTCHGNHAVVRPTIAMLAPLPRTPCQLCHELPEGMALDARYLPEVREHYREVRRALLAQAGDRQGEALFDWLVERARRLEWHTTLVETEAGRRVRRLEPEVERLFSKFRIGETTYGYRDPETGEVVRAPVVRCVDCHEREPHMADEPRGFEASRAYVRGMRALTSLTARAERLVLAARRGGVLVRDGASQIDQAVQSQIQLEVLVHTFEAGEGSEFAAEQAEGLGHARQAVAEGRAALDDLADRRRGLAVSLVIVALVIVLLASKIRQVSRPRPGAPPPRG